MCYTVSIESKKLSTFLVKSEVSALILIHYKKENTMKTENELREIGKKVLFDYDIKYGYVTLIRTEGWDDLYYLTPFKNDDVLEDPFKLEDLLDYYTDLVREWEVADSIDEALEMIKKDVGCHSDRINGLFKSYKPKTEAEIKEMYAMYDELAKSLAI
jgi:hypothetical protein